MSAPDVIVVGAGIAGVSAAWELHQRGVAVTLLDRGEVSGGTTGLGEGNVLCGDKDAGVELDLSVLGRALFDELEDELGAVAGIRRKGSLIVHPDERTWAVEPARVARLEASGVETTLLEGADAVRAIEPALAGPLHGAAHIAGDLQVAPREITRALAERLPDARTGVTVARITVAGHDGRITGVRTNRGEEIAAGAVVLAAGPWSARLALTTGLKLPVEPRKGQLVRLALDSPDEQYLRTKIVDGSYLLSVVSEGSARELSTVIETTVDGDVLVGSSRERCGFDDSVDEALADAMRERAARLVPSLAHARARTAWVGFRPWLPDHLPAIGASRRVPGLYATTGHEGAGVCLGPISGRLVAQQLTGEAPACDLTPFDPDRFATTAHRSRGAAAGTRSDSGTG